MIVDLPESLEAALKVRANAHGVSPEGYVCEVLERVLSNDWQLQATKVPFKTGRGSFEKHGQAPSGDEIEANRAEIFRNFGESY
jgi:plasmid stability protein